MVGGVVFAPFSRTSYGGFGIIYRRFSSFRGLIQEEPYPTAGHRTGSLLSHSASRRVLSPFHPNDKETRQAVVACGALSREQSSPLRGPRKDWPASVEMDGLPGMESTTQEQSRFLPLRLRSGCGRQQKQAGKKARRCKKTNTCNSNSNRQQSKTVGSSLRS